LVAENLLEKRLSFAAIQDPQNLHWFSFGFDMNYASPVSSGGLRHSGPTGSASHRVAVFNAARQHYEPV